eukprot:GILI01024828.1.p1 GENE.GILI01024828.1~~GILI01024828.1.p1  ORF type:complete len:395 (+),score=94.96 GILI01024828.1:44-1228(+)
MAALSPPPTLPPCLIRETLYAPPCPPAAAALFDTGLTLQNEGKFAFAINATLQAQQAWEQGLLEEHYPDIEDKVAHSILLRLRQNEKLELEAAEAERKQRELEEEEQAAKDEEEFMRQIGELKAESDEATDAKRVQTGANKQSKDAKGISSTPQAVKPTSPEPEAANAPPDPNAIFLQQQQDKLNAAREEEARRRAAEELEAQIKFDKERERKRQEKIQALHHVYQLLPIEGKIFIQLRLSSIYESAGDDEKALASALHALKFVQTLPVYTDNIITATIYEAIGTIYAHLAQLDYASDYYFKALEIREMMLNTEHVDTATAMHNVGCILHMLEKPNDAMVCFYKALEVFKRLLPSSHPRIETCESNVKKSKEMQFKGLVVPTVPPLASTSKKKA